MAIRSEVTTRPDFNEEAWLRKLGGFHPGVLLPGFWTNVAANCERWAREVSVGDFWTQANERLDSWRTEYRNSYGGDLLARPGLPDFTSKSEGSIRGKLLRRCKEDSNYAQAIQTEGPPIPCLPDLVRTRIACRYIDGVEFLASRILALAQEMNLSPKLERKGSIEGYFAQHITADQQVFFRLAGEGQPTKIVCEIQIASEMATRMWDATHPLYENVRRDPAEPEDWQWKPNDSRFISNQLGHMVHLVDGLLVQLRQSVNKRKV